MSRMPVFLMYQLLLWEDRSICPAEDLGRPSCTGSGRIPGVQTFSHHYKKTLLDTHTRTTNYTSKRTQYNYSLRSKITVVF
jgi:hypothetical protein